jgi:hypothetical protein
MKPGMTMAIFAKTETEKLQAEVDRLEKKRTTLAGRLVAAQSAEASARDAQRRYLVESDDTDVSKGAKHAADVASASADVAALVDALSTVDALIAEGQTAIVAARESAARTKRAAEIQERIRKIEPMAATAEKQFEALLATLEKITAEADDPALDVRQYVELQGHVDRLAVTSIIGASLAQALFRDAPDLMTVEKTGAGLFARAYLPMMIARYEGLSRDLPIDHGDENSFTPKPLSGTLTENIIAPLRMAAKEILAGSRPLATAKPMIAEPETDDTTDFEYRRLVLTKPIRWRDHRGETITTPDSDATIPEPVAAAAKAAGVAFEHESKEGEHHLDRRIERGFHNDATIMNKEIVDLKISWPATTKATA